MGRLSLALVSLLFACQPVARTTTPTDPSSPLATSSASGTTTTTAAKAPTDPKLVELDAVLERSAIAADRPAVLTARVRMSAATAENAERPPLALVLVVDTSGSMAGTAIEDARAAARAFVEPLRDDDRISVVTFDSRAEVLVEATSVKALGRKAILERIGRMQARGTTDMTAGLQAAYAQISSAPSGAVRRVVMLSDGVPNDATQIPAFADSLRANGVAVTTLGFGLEYDETLLGRIAQATGGSFRRVDQGEALAKAFVDEAFRAERLVASNVVLTLQAGPGVEIRRVLGHPAVAPGSRVHNVVLADLSERQRQDVFVELAITGHRAGANVELLDATVAFQERTVNAGRLERRSFLAVQASDESDVVSRARDRSIEREAARARAAATMLDAIALARSAQFAEARAVLDKGEQDARAHASDDPELKAQLEEIRKLRKTIVAEAKAHAAAMREVARKSKHPVSPGTVVPTPAPFSAVAGSADGVRGSHARAMDRLQPQG
jgi:Ca-activated chloride channel family protein